jgi:hypothetical protein
MKSKLLFLIILVAGLLFINYSVGQVYGQTPQNKPVKQQTVMYTCTMHPEVIQDHPGNCPKCGMKLVEKKDKSKGDMHHSLDSIMMKHDHKKMMHDSTNMKKCDMKHDSASMKKCNMMHDTTTKKHENKKMYHKSLAVVFAYETIQVC